MARRQENEESGWETFAKIAVGATAAAVGIGALIGAMSELSTETREQPHSSYTVREASSDEDEPPRAITYQMASDEFIPIGSQRIQYLGPPIRNIHALLDDIYANHIALKKDEFEEHYNVFQATFGRLHEMMKEVDPYYKRYSSTQQFAGSHYDGLRIIKPDEFDMDIVIRLPISMDEDPVPAQSDIILEHKTPGYVQLKMGNQFQRLPFKESWNINMTAYEWMDDKKYLLRSKFLNWFKSVVVRALNCFGKNEYGLHFTPIDSVFHTIRISGTGPAVTLIIENEDGFMLSVDLVPALRFPEKRWPICRGYREIPQNCKKEYFMVVPKESRALVNKVDKDRAWRLALHLQEKELIYDTNHLRQTIRFIKKLRDSQGMVQVKSYFINTLFYLEVIQLPNSAYWQNNPATLLLWMARKLEQALRSGTIPYFWYKDNSDNLLWDVDRSNLTGYANKLKEFIRVLESPSEFREVAKYMLTREEYEVYRRKLEQ